MICISERFCYEGKESVIDTMSYLRAKSIVRPVGALISFLVMIV